MLIADTTIASLIKELTDKTSFRNLISLEQELILGIDSDKVLPQIEDLIANKAQLITVILLYMSKINFFLNIMYVVGIAVDLYAICCEFWTETKGFGILQERNYPDLRLCPSYNHDPSRKVWAHKNTSNYAFKSTHLQYRFITSK